MPINWFELYPHFYVQIYGNALHYGDVIMERVSTIASQITSLTIVFSTVYSDADQK